MIVIVPKNSQPLVKAVVPNRDIGFTHEDQEAKVESSQLRD